MTQIEEKTRQSIAAFLPDILDRALLSYAAFAENNAPGEEAKDFAAHHNACKVAIAHIELLIKLARWADLEDEARAAEARRAALEAGTLAEIAAAVAEAEDAAEQTD